MKKFKLILIILFYSFFIQSSKAQLPINDYRLNEVSQKACHNCFELKYTKSMYEALNSVNAIEIDFYDSKNILNKKDALPERWYVRHEGIDKNSGNLNCCDTLPDGRNDLEACIAQIKNWHLTNKDHDLLTIFLDKKQNWSINRNPKDLDNLILKYFSVDELLTPNDILKSQSFNEENTLKWPYMITLKNRVMFVLTGGNLFFPNQTLSVYTEQRLNNALIFIAPIVKKNKEIMNKPKRISQISKQYVWIYNINGFTESLNNLASSQNKLTRVFNIEKKSKDKNMVFYKTNYSAFYNFSISFPKIARKIN